MKSHLLLLFAFLFVCPIHGSAQPLINQDDHLVTGFDKKIAGDDFVYRSSVPSAEDALIVRATDGKYQMEWQTAKVETNVKEKYITFVWLAGIGSSPGLSEMTLTLNNSATYTFQTDGFKDWRIQHPDGSELFFHSDMTDQHGDKFGFMYLRVPNKPELRGQVAKMKVTGGKNGKSSWYMTFKMPVKTGITLKALPAVIKDEGQNKQLLALSVIHFGLPQTASIYANGKLIRQQEVKFGYNYIRFGLPEVKKKTLVNVKYTAGNYSENLKQEQFPVRPWQVNFVQHSHTDIGYTRSQTEILAEHLRYIDYALDYCDATDNYPDEARFRWTCEAAWAVDEFLKCRPSEQIERLKKRVREGRIEIAAMYFNFDELTEEQALAASLQPLKRFREHGLETKMAMQNDVNGIAWCMNDFYKDLGIKYLNMGTHGHRALICFDKPTLFWWESPSGNRMLAFRAEHYMTGNTVFEIDKKDMANFETRLFKYLNNLSDKGYEYNTISIQHSGYLTDNSPPSTTASEVIKQWNETYVWPKLKTSTATAFFEEMEAKQAGNFPVYRGAWPDWWTDGFGASAREVAAVRKAQSDISAYSGGMAMAQVMGSHLPVNIQQRIDLVNNALLFYTEHTVGYSESVREPYHEQTMEQRAIKESYSWESYRRAKMVGEETMGLLQSHINNEAKPTLFVFNTLNWNRDGLAYVYIDHQIVPRDVQPLITDQSGNICSVQAVKHRSDGTTWAIWVKNIPAFGYKKLLIDHGDQLKKIASREPTAKLENQWFSIKVDPQKGAVTSWFDKELNQELLDPDSKYGMGEFIYELLGNRYQMEQKRMNDFKRYSLDSAWFESYAAGPVWNTIHLKGKTAASYEGHNMDIEIRLFNTTKRIDLAYSIVKKPIIDPEGIYIAFPFKLENAKHYFEVQGGVVEAGKDQIPGSSNDWNTVQHYSALRNGKAQIIMGSQEIPLVQFGNINTGRYKAGALPETTHLFSWPMNNYWVTNFNPDQKGQHEWTYFLTSSTDISNGEAARFGWSARTPFLTRILPGGGKGDNVWESSIMKGWPENILLVNASPVEGEHAIVLQVREINGNPADLSKLCNKSDKPFSITRINVNGEKIENGSSLLKGYENAFFRIGW